MRSLALSHLEAVRRLVAEHAGLEIPDLRTGELVGIVCERVRASRAEDPASYLDELRARTARGQRELDRIVEGLLVHETYFFRGLAQLEVLVDRVIPERARARGGRHVHVLSAGTATGAEAYSVAILLLERHPDLASAVRIEGIDIAPAAIEVARRGSYLPWVLRETPPAIVQRWFRSRGGRHELRDDVRAMVSFEVANLLGPDPARWAPGTFDAILCRNVLMYLGRAPAQALVSRFERSLSPGGYLFLGHAEHLRGLDTRLEQRAGDDAFAYRLPLDAAHAAPRATTPRTEARGGAAREHARSRAEEATAPAPRPTPEVLVRRALALVERGDLGRAVEACARAREADALDPVPHYLEALCRDRAGDLPGAIHHDRTAAYLDPTFAMPWLHLAILEKRGGDPEAARRRLERALVLLDRDDDERLLLLGGGLDRAALARVCCAELLRTGARR